MSGLTFSHLSSATFEKESQKKAGRKRPRIREAVSCWQCRSRKIRCDREQPCQPCVERNAGAKCTYSQTKTSTGGTGRKSGNASTLEKTPSSPTAKSSTPPSSAAARNTPWASNGPDGPDARRQSSTRSSTRSSLSTRPSSLGSVSTSKGHAFQGSNRKTRLISVSHWMAPCNEMKVVKALLAGSDEFQSSLQEFAGLKEHLRRANTIPFELPSDAATADGRLSPSVLLDGLPDRKTCEKWIGRYFQGYGRVYDIVDPATLAADVHQAFSGSSDTQYGYATAMNSVYILRILITVALGMQMSEPDRLHGRQLGRLVEYFVHRAARIQKPCVGSVQVLLQLVLLKTVRASDTDTEHDSMEMLGLANHITLMMGLHRDPALFDEIPPYYAEQRKRLWACFFRLHLAYCIRTGTQFPVRLEDGDCPLPTPSVLQAPFTETLIGSESIRSCAKAWSLGEKEAENDAFFSYASAKLAHILAPAYQTLCSTKPRVTADQREALQSGFSALMAKLPSSLQPGTPVTDSMVELQRTMLSTCMHSFFLIVSLSRLFGGTDHTPASTTSEASLAEPFSTQRPQLLEIWDYTISVLTQFQNMCPADGSMGKSAPRHKSKAKSSASLNTSVADASVIAHHLLWTYAGRAALAACLVVGRLRRQERERALPFSVRPQQQHTAAIFQQMLSQTLESLLQLWRSKYHLGPVTAKTSLILAVTAAVTANLYLDVDAVFDRGVEAARLLVSDMKEEIEQRLTSAAASPSRIFDSGASTETPQQHTTAAKTMPLVSSVSKPPGVAPSGDTIPQMSTIAWAPTGLYDSSVSHIPDLSTSSSTASHAASPDYGGVGGSSDIFGMDFIQLGGVPNGYDTAACPFTGDIDNPFMEFSGGTIMNMF